VGVSISSAPHKSTVEYRSNTVVGKHIEERKHDSIKFSMAICCGLLNGVLYCGLDWVWAKANTLDPVLAIQIGFRARERLWEDRRNLEWTWRGRMGAGAKRKLAGNGKSLLHEAH
jgi:hypothetical protein